MTIRIERWDPRQDGPLTEAALRQKVESRGYAVSIDEWPAGAIVAAQAQADDRIDAVVSGLLKITLNDESAILNAGDFAYVPHGVLRRVEVLGAAPARCFDAVRRRAGGAR